MFLIDKYKPTCENESSFHKNILDMLKIMSKDDAIPHIIFYGPESSGKKTMINMFLSMLFGPNVYNTKDVSYDIVGSGGKKTTEKIKQSNYHIIINPKNTNYDRYLLKDIVKEYAKRKTLNTILEKKSKQFKLVLINDLDNLSFCVQAALRRTMERYNDKCRFIMCSKSLSKVIEPLQSRCVCIRVPSPTDDEIFMYLLKISIKEKIEIKSLTEYDKIIKSANGNIKNALWRLQYKQFGYEYTNGFIESVQEMADLLLSGGGLELVDTIRNIFYSLTITNFNGNTILKSLIETLYDSDKLTDKIRQKILEKGQETEYGLVRGRREIYHFDDFIISVLKIMNHEQNI